MLVNLNRGLHDGYVLVNPSSVTAIRQQEGLRSLVFYDGGSVDVVGTPTEVADKLKIEVR
ncbi:hypothetical protein LCGC14_0736410 [marine sediment metagenome]|uniref:Uncharacterized protein n=1 Tax=marine sediment metagenome TaxID=412755 RepID=A0A0F9TF91_9ZZZZ